MNASTHVKHMVSGAAAVLALALLAGVPLQSALPLAILLACPLMMVVMMATMSGGHGQGHGTGTGTGVGSEAPQDTAVGSTPDGPRSR